MKVSDANFNFRVPRDLKRSFKTACNGSDQTTVTVKLMSIFIEWTKGRFCHNAARFEDKYYKLVEINEDEYQDYIKKIEAYKKPRVIKNNPFI